MDPASLNSGADAPRKRRFKLKPPTRQLPKAEVKAEVVEDADANQAKDLLRRFNEGLMKPKPKVEKKVAPTKIAFGYGGASTTIKSYGVPKSGSSNRCQGSASNGGTCFSALREEKEYQEPWDYHSNYPVSLPLRKPYSGNPELLDAEEFRADSEAITYDESSTKAAVELDLTEENPEPQIFFLQLPPTLPSTKRLAVADSQEATERHNKQKPCALNDLPAGLMGKMLVYRSGAVKLKLGDTLYDVSSGMKCGFAQDVVAINSAEKHCCIVGELNKRITLTPDVDCIIKSMADL